MLAHFFLKEKLEKMDVLGCVLCVVGSTMIVLHAPGERTPSSVDEIWELATQPSKVNSKTYPDVCLTAWSFVLIILMCFVQLSFSIRPRL